MQRSSKPGDRSKSYHIDENWTKISDYAERRQIQNRIALRTYRKNLKKRLEDLERRAASSSASPEQKPAELQGPPPSPRQELPPSSSLNTTLSAEDFMFSFQLPTDPPASNAPVDSIGYFAPPYDTTQIFFESATSRALLPLPSQHSSHLECYYPPDFEYGASLYIDGYAAIGDHSTVQ
ncbi:hypothetical protein AA0117_g13196 [Alternaria alternata]|uniref:BZIP domain-containing protein n=1 Tax=Alternaria alternata TaxID=5599 RepID=A0A4Q4MSI6_ALTAL|nr:hypothetical protein AA0117_g13196 [Alternaria alternata]